MVVLIEEQVNFYFCLCGALRPTGEFSLMWRRHHYRGEGLQILTYARHLLPLSSNGSLACHTYYDTGHPFIMDLYMFSATCIDILFTK